MRLDAESETLLPTVYQCQGTNVGEMGTLRGGNGNETGGVPFVVTGSLNANGKAAGSATQQDAESGILIATIQQFGEQVEECPDNGDVVPRWHISGHCVNLVGLQEVVHSLKGEGHDASEDGTGRGMPMAFAQNQEGECCTGAVVNTLNSNSNASGRNTPMIMQPNAVRRLTPTECERLMGFTDNYTNIPGAADGPRYRALGNSMAVPVIQWIGRRIIDSVNSTDCR